MAAGQSLVSSNQVITISADDVILNGTIDSGTTFTVINPSTGGTLILDGTVGTATGVSTNCGGACDLTLAGVNLPGTLAAGDITARLPIRLT